MENMQNYILPQQEENTVKKQSTTWTYVQKWWLVY